MVQNLNKRYYRKRGQRMRKGGNLKQNTKGLEPSRMKGCEKLISTMDGGGEKSYHQEI